MTPQQLKAMKMALEALELCNGAETVEGVVIYTDKEITALNEALAEHAMRETQRLGQKIEQCQCTECQIKPHASDCAVHSEPAYPKGKCDCGAQPEQEPVAIVTSETGNPDITMSWWHEPALPVGTKLYTHPPQRTWVELTDEQANEYNYLGPDMPWVVREVAAILKERNQ